MDFTDEDLVMERFSWIFCVQVITRDFIRRRQVGQGQAGNMTMAVKREGKVTTEAEVRERERDRDRERQRDLKILGCWL